MLNIFKIENIFKSKVFMANMNDQIQFTVQNCSGEIFKDYFEYVGLNVAEETCTLDLLFSMVKDPDKNKNVIICVDFDTCQVQSINISYQLELFYSTHNYELLDLIHYVYLPTSGNYKYYHLENFRDYFSPNLHARVLNLVDNKFYDWLSTTFPKVDLLQNSKVKESLVRLQLIRHNYEKYWLVKPREDGTKLINFN